MAGQVEGGRFRRMAKLAGLAARTTADVVTARAKQAVMGGDEGAVGEALKPTAERMVEVLGEMKGIATKLGQFIAVVDQDGFPEQARQALQTLLHQAPRRMPAEEARQVVFRELGKTPEELFAHFEPEPFAAASMGQVHAATLHDGRDVVVKLQFPGVDVAIESDLRNMAGMTGALSLGGKVADFRGYFEEIAQTLRRELDYREEAKQAEEFRIAAAPWPDLVIPQPVPELSTHRLLTMERLRGPTLLEFANNPDSTEAERYRVGRQLVESSWGPLLSVGLIHADPHPGNYIVLPDGRLGVLDFGATRWIARPFVEAYQTILQAKMRGEDVPITPVLSAVGFTFRADPATTERWLGEVQDIVSRPIVSDFYDWGACRMSADMNRFNLRNPQFPLLSRPPEQSLMFYRAIAGMAGDLRILRSKGDFRVVVEEILARAAVTG